MNPGYVPGLGPLRRAHPFTPLTLAAVLAALGFIAPAPVGPAVVLTMAVIIPIVEGVPGVLRLAAITALPFWVFSLIIRGLVLGDPVLAISLALRITTVLVAFLTALAVVHPARLVDALLERGFPFSLAYILAATLQAVPRFRDRGREILDAQRCRGLRVQGSPWARARAVLPLAVPLIMGALAEVDQRAFALEARGAGQVTRRTPLHPPPDSPAQRTMRWGLVAVAGLALVIRIAS